MLMLDRALGARARFLVLEYIWTAGLNPRDLRRVLNTSISRPREAVYSMVRLRAQRESR